MNNLRNTERAFIALDLPDSAKDSLDISVKELRASLPTGIRWVDPKGIHLTLKFLGDVDTDLLEQILESMGLDGRRIPVAFNSLGSVATGSLPQCQGTESTLGRSVRGNGGSFGPSKAG